MEDKFKPMRLIIGGCEITDQKEIDRILLKKDPDYILGDPLHSLGD